VTSNAWTLVQPARAAPRARLFCFPYAGAGATVFHGWSAALPPDVEVIAIKLPGRESRLRERAFTRMEDLIAVLREVVAGALDLPYALFGHSMGARIAFELARALRDAARPAPLHLYVSGCRAPQVPRNRATVHDRSDDDLRAELRAVYDAPAALLDDPELAAIYLPILRADLTLHETHPHRVAAPLAAPLTAFGGADDPIVRPADLDAWAEHTRAGFDVAIFPGGHLFVRSARAAVLARLAEDLARSP
jgi:medium-chain acyl-[acyl-carrier-protein] hydrolase